MVLADWGFGSAEREIADLPPAVRDSYLEYRIQRALAADPEAERKAHVRVVAFGSHFLILGDVADAATKDRIDTLVLRVTGVERRPLATDAGAVQTRECAKRSRAVSAKRRFNLTGAKGDCGSLLASDQDEASGWVDNLLLIRPMRRPADRAADQLLAARVQADLVERGFEAVMNTRRMRLAAQDGVVYLLGAEAPQTMHAVAEAARAIEGVSAVRILTERDGSGSRPRDGRDSSGQPD